MSKSVRVVLEALTAGRAAWPAYGGRFSRCDDTQAQLFALLVLRQFLRTDDRGIVVLVAAWAERRRALGPTKVPHYSTLAHASRRIFTDAEAGGLLPRSSRGGPARARAQPDDAASVAAVDATGLETRHVSAYFGFRL